MNPKYPVFVPTKGRYESRFTIKALENIGVPYTAVIEQQEYDNYAAVVNPKNILVLPHQNKGLVVTRNWIWNYALSKGYKKFWTMDDNIVSFHRLNRNLKPTVSSGTILKVIEDFTERYENVPISGMHYYMFAPRKTEVPPFYLNTRVYSNMLIETEIKDPNGKYYRNEGFYNDDTDLCLRILKDGFCTILFNAFLIKKSVTMTVKGGMTEHYLGDGRYKMAKELQEKHPDVTTITQKWGRYQHQVDYSRFKRNKLIKKAGIVIPQGVNNYGMVLKYIGYKKDREEKRISIKQPQQMVQNFATRPPKEYPMVEAKYPDLSSAKYISIDVETKDPGIMLDGLSALKKEGYIIGFSIATDDGFKAYYPLKHPGEGNVDREKTVAWLKQQMSYNIPKVGANIIYDLEWMYYDFGIKVQGQKICIQAIEALLDETRKTYKLDAIARDRCNLAKDENSLYEEADRLGISHTEIKANLWQMCAGAVRPYGEGDADLPIKILEKQLPLIQKQGMEKVFDLECGVIDVLFAMRLQGLRVDISYAEQLKADTAIKEKEARAKLRSVAGREIDVWSGNDIALVANNLGFKFPLTAKQNPSFTNDWLESQDIEFFHLLREVRNLNRLSKIFIESKVLNVAYNGRVYPSYFSTRRDDYGTRTGRFSSANPNMQQVPSRDEALAPLIRSIFLPEEGEQWETYDYNQQEPRMLVHFANICKLAGADIAKAKYTEDANTDYHQFTADLAGIKRKLAKIINLGMSYGMGKSKLAQELGLPFNEAEVIFNKYHESLPYVRGFSEFASRLAEDRGWVKTILGRRRHFDQWGPYKFEKGIGPQTYEDAVATWGANNIKRWSIYRAGNSIISGSSADLTKKAMVDVFKATGKAPLVTVHDENDYSNSDPKISKVILDCMLNAIKLEVPLKVDYEKGPSWGKAC
jgi:DNA polymerase I-like protein with 3'-5' exonuclease and polymerase domains